MPGLHNQIQHIDLHSDVVRAGVSNETAMKPADEHHLTISLTWTARYITPVTHVGDLLVLGTGLSERHVRFIMIAHVTSMCLSQRNRPGIGLRGPALAHASAYSARYLCHPSRSLVGMLCYIAWPGHIYRGVTQGKAR